VETKKFTIKSQSLTVLLEILDTRTLRKQSD